MLGTTIMNRTRLPIPSTPRHSFPVRTLTADALTRRTDGDNVFMVPSQVRCKTRIPLAEKDLNVEHGKDDDREGEEELSNEEILRRLQRLHSKPRKQIGAVTKLQVVVSSDPPATPVKKSVRFNISIDDSLLVQALSRHALSIPQTPSRARVSTSNQSTLGVSIESTATRPKYSSPLSPCPSTRASLVSLSQRLLERPLSSVASRKLRKCQDQHHGYSKSSLVLIRSLWAACYKDWLYKNLNLRRRSSSDTSSSSETTPSDLNPNTFPRIGSLYTLHSSNKDTELQGQKIDWFFGRCSLSSICRTLYIFDLNRRLSATATGCQDRKTEEFNRSWETDWEVRWQVLDAILQNIDASLEQSSSISQVPLISIGL